MMATELQRIQRAVGEVLIPQARANQRDLPTMEHSLPVALELFYTSFAMKSAHRQAGTFIARAYASRMGLDADQVEAFALHRLNEVAASSVDDKEGE